MMTRKEKPRFKTVVVRWRDAAFNKGWKEAHEATLVDCWTSGFLIHRDKKVVKVALSMSDEGMYGEVMVIPKSEVTSMRIVR
jgi:hypothetical protein